MGFSIFASSNFDGTGNTLSLVRYGSGNPKIETQKSKLGLLARHRILPDRLVATHPAPAAAAALARPTPTSSFPQQSYSTPSSMVAPGQPVAAAGALHSATAAKASSEYRATNYGAGQATGAPNVRVYGDSGNARAPKADDGGPACLALSYTSPVRATGVRGVQSFNLGAVTKIEVINADGAVVATWSGPDATSYTPKSIGVLEMKFAAAPQPVATVKLTLDTKRVPGSNAIDAVALLSEP